MGAWMDAYEQTYGRRGGGGLKQYQRDFPSGTSRRRRSIRRGKYSYMDSRNSMFGKAVRRGNRLF